MKVNNNIETMLTRLGKSENPGALVKALAPHDLLVAWHLADDEQRADLLQLADKEQTDLLIDLSCWPTNLPDLDKLEALIEPLCLRGPGGAVQMLDTVEPELRTQLLRRNVRVHLLDNRNDEIQAAEESEIIACPDGLYYIEFPFPEEVTDVERALWGALISRPFVQYQPELECIRHDFLSELQETALRWRLGRLADFGFVGREEAFAVLAPRSVDEVRRLAERVEIKTIPLTSNISLPLLYRDNLKEDDFLDRVLEALEKSDDPETMSRFANLGAELAVMINRFLTAASADISNLDDVARCTGWAGNLLTLGLSETAGGNIEQGIRLLAKLAPVVFLQVGLGLSYPLRDRARLLLNDMRIASAGSPGAIFDPPHHIALLNLTEDIPRHWPRLEKDAGLSTDLFIPNSFDFTTFSKKEALSSIDRFLSEAEQIPSLLFDTLGCEAPLPEATSASMLILTALVNAANSRDPRPFPVTFSEAKIFIRHVVSLDRDRFAYDALAVLAPLFEVVVEGPSSPAHERDPKRRLLLRLIAIGRSRLSIDAPENAMLIEPVL